jgi:excisionase family DNA binding protein
MTSDLLTPEEAAVMLRLNRETIYRNLRRGKLPGTKLGGQWRISKTQLETMLGGAQLSTPDVRSIDS